MTKPLIQVCGDPTVDWLTIRGDSALSGGSALWRREYRERPVRLSSEPGGAAMLSRLISELVPGKQCGVDGITIEKNLTEYPESAGITTSWSVWVPYMDADKESRYRLEGWHERGSGTWDYAFHHKNGRPDLLVIEDTNLGFRSHPSGWPEALQADSSELGPDLVLMRMTQYGDGDPNPIRAHLIKTGLARKTTVVTSVNDLRLCAVKIGVSLSWERMFEEVVAAVLSRACPFVGDDGRLVFDRVIVNIGTAGAVIIDQESQTLIFDQNGQEGDFQAQRQGSVPGYSICVVAALAAAWASGSAQLDWVEGTRRGVALARKLHMVGYEVEGCHLRFPYGKLVHELKVPHLDSPAWALGVFRNVGEVANGTDWSILQKTISTQSVNAIADCARKIVVTGPRRAMPEVPVERIGDWSSADRQEIEGVRSVKNAIEQYLTQTGMDRPLSIGVFGPPGSGKSFAVREITKAQGIQSKAALTFNLSQFESPGELATAFHQIRDLNLKGLTPLVFWDEFDTPCAGRQLGWLRYFLAPMQDGEFTDQGQVRPLGRGIYVFAGATRHSFREFSANSGPDDLAAKKPDFVSRLRAYIDVRGPNSNPNSAQDALGIIRRAFLLHARLEGLAKHLKDGGSFQVDDSVLDAFLQVSHYRHGARSMDTILRMSALTGKRKYELSSLPPDSILDMHVPAREFNALTRLGYLGTLRVGLVGASAIDGGREEDVAQAVRRVAKSLEESFPNRTLTVFSSLSTLGDRLAARELFRRDTTGLIAVLPLPLQEYLGHFGPSDDYAVDKESAELRHEFRYWLQNRASEVIEMEPAPTRASAFEKAGCFVADHCDVLVAVWDRQNPGNCQGPAGLTVKRAEERQIPIFHVCTNS